jgi:hypothetical protein
MRVYIEDVIIYFSYLIILFFSFFHEVSLCARSLLSVVIHKRYTEEIPGFIPTSPYFTLFTVLYSRFLDEFQRKSFIRPPALGTGETNNKLCPTAD